jgi:hypothetical protein
MKNVLIGLAVIVLVPLVCVGVLLIGYISWSNEANKFEADIPAQYEQMKNVYDNGWKEVMETSQVPDNYTDDMKSVWQAALTGRYGASGSQAVLQFIKESNPNLDPSLYRAVQEKIEEFHSTFSTSQTRIISLKQSYNQYITATTAGRFYNMIGHYPHLRVGIPYGSQDDFAILTSGKTTTDFQKHEADALQLRHKK